MATDDAHRSRSIGVACMALAVALIASACTGLAENDPGPTTTTTADDAQTSTTTTTLPEVIPVYPSVPVEPPELPDAAEVAEAVLVAPPGYRETGDGGVFESDAVFAIGLWLPNGIVSGTAARVYDGPGGDLVTVVSVIPTMGWRADPGLVPALAALDEDGPVEEVTPFVYAATTDAGLPVALWSTGDGFLVAASPEPDAATAYLAAMESLRTPQDVWAPGACLYIDPVEGLPWAPFPGDAVVPCSGSHNAEVLHAEKIGTDLEDFDGDGIAYERRHVCDEVYESAIGPQRDRTPMLITYMPDEDEWQRGDRYLACVIQLEVAEGPLLVTGSITDRSDLSWRPGIGSCFVASLAPDPVDCSTPHTYQFLGEVEYVGETWPDDPIDAFGESCAPLLADLSPGPVPIDAFGTDLHPYAFENGERRIRCMAFARSDTGLETVLGGFDEEWRLLGDGGIPA